jgi:hypothetical protein
MSWKVKAEPFACLERAAKSPHSSLRAGKPCDSSACSEDIRGRGEALERALRKALPSPGRCNQKSGWTRRDRFRTWSLNRLGRLGRFRPHMRKPALIVPNASHRLVVGRTLFSFVFCIDATPFVPPQWLTDLSG